MIVTFLMPASRKVEGKTAWIIGTAATLVFQSISESATITIYFHMNSNHEGAYLTAGGVNVNEAKATSSSDELSNPATVIVH